MPPSASPAADGPVPAPSGGVAPAAAPVHVPVRMVLGLLALVLGDGLASVVPQVAAPELAGSVGASVDEGIWLTLGYSIGKLLGLLAAPAAVARWGLASTLRACAWGIVYTALALAAEPSWAAAVGVRTLQGLAGGAATTAAFAALVLNVPRPLQALSQGAWGITTVLGPAALAVLGGPVADAVGWRMALALAAPLGLLALVLQRGAVPEHVAGAGRAELAARDPLGLLGWAAVAAGSQFVAVQGVRLNWGDVPWLLPLIGGLGAVAALGIAWQASAANASPLVGRAPLRRPEFVFACVTVTVAGYGATGSAMLAPMYVRRLFGYAAADAGAMQALSLAPIALGLVLSAVCTWRRWVSPMVLIVGGMLAFLAALGLWSMATWQVDLPFVAMVVALRGFGLGLSSVPTAIVAFTSLDGMAAVHGAALYQALRQLGGTAASLSLTWRLAETQARYRYNIGLHLSAADPAIAQRLAEGGEHLVARGLGAGSEAAGGLAAVARALSSQVLVLAYNAAFIELAVVYGACMVAALAYRTLAPAPPAAADAHGPGASPTAPWPPPADGPLQGRAPMAPGVPRRPRP